ncbi:MAG TPA: hypothetical protein DEF36_14825 [Desulfotomaculum sp.]|nr:hypothetical protein [Desulfotomaculum sp.]
MPKKDYSGRRFVTSYQLSAGQLEELHRKYGRPGEMSPGKPAPKKRNRLDAALAAMDRREKGKVIPPPDEDHTETDIIKTISLPSVFETGSHPSL